MLSPVTNTTSSLPVGPGAAAQGAATALVRVAAPGRLHLGFLDPSASLGRRFGSLGLVIDGPQTVLELGWAEPGATTDVCSAAPHLAPDHGAAELTRVRAHLAALRLALGAATGASSGSGTATATTSKTSTSVCAGAGSERSPSRHDLSRALRLHLADALPAHAGLGSGTQLGLAVGRAFCELHGIDLPTAQIARITGRGLRSGVGIAGFDAGGLLLDAGPPPAGVRGAGGPAPLLSRIDLPADWRVLLVLDPGRRGLSGDDERAAIARLAPLPREAAAEICHEVVMRVLAGAASDDFAAFAAGLNRVQQVLGDHFAPAQGGSAYTSPAVARLLTWLAQQGKPRAAGDQLGAIDKGRAAGSGSGAAAPCAVGQSSWGPTGFAIYASQADAEAALAAARAAGQVGMELQVSIVGARSHGARIRRVSATGGGNTSLLEAPSAASPSIDANASTAPGAAARGNGNGSGDIQAHRLSQAA
ncbi:MAG: beta-ribofuranosylaminobenzene 5'-phosphate synthase [Burkholderiales bacterium]|nr:beta-ribofuranosylaminobenzene 5'-phosphate synthase [Burkholderiales bacterium]